MNDTSAPELKVESTHSPRFWRIDRAGAGLWLDEPMWPWLAGAAIGWIGWLSLRGDALDSQQGVLILICAAAMSVAAAFVNHRREDHNTWVKEMLSRLSSRDEVLDLLASGEVPTTHACPCGGSHTVRDAGGYYVGMARWLVAVSDLTEAAQRGMKTKGYYRPSLVAFAEDTELIAEMLIRWCHAESNVLSSWSLNGLLVAWEKTFHDLEAEFADMAGDTTYQAWRAASIGTRQARHGTTIDPYRVADEEARKTEAPSAN